MTLAWEIRGGDEESLCAISSSTQKLQYLTLLQTHFPAVEKAIIDRLNALRGGSVPLTLVTIRGISIAMLINMAPEIFDIKASDGSSFRCSDTFLREWLHNTMGWSERKATRAAQKLPDNWEDVCEKAIIRMAYLMKEEDIPATLYVNTDQTQIIYVQGSNLTWTKRGAKQVATIGEDKKRAFTAVISVSCSGKLLPLQLIYQGATSKLCPRPTATNYDQCISHGFRFECSKTDTYWSTQESMQSLVDNIIAPYFEAEKRALGLPSSQKTIWQIDVWSVHRAEKFRSWMKTYHPSIILQYVPGGCTGILQPCDVGIQRVFKHALKCSYHEDVVRMMTHQIESGTEDLVFDKRRGQLRDLSVKWIWDAFKSVNKPEIVKKV